MTRLVPFTIDLTAHEGTRLAAVLDALGPHWDPIQDYTDEEEAHCMPRQPDSALHTAPPKTPSRGARKR